MKNLKHKDDAETLGNMICAEIPNKYYKQELDANHKKLEDLEINPLWKAVTSFMLHGPYNTSIACMKQGYCKYGYPKPYVSVTEMSENGYPVYCRQSPEQGEKLTYHIQKRRTCHVHQYKCCAIQQVPSLQIQLSY